MNEYMNVHKEKEVMSKEFQLILVLILIGAGFLFYKISLHSPAENYQNASFKTLDDLKSRGQVEVHSYEEWKKKNKVKSTQFEKWKSGQLQVSQDTVSPKEETKTNVDTQAESKGESEVLPSSTVTEMNNK